MPKCCICKKDLNKEEAYMFIHVSKTGKEYKKYACSEEEVENERTGWSGKPEKEGR